MLKNFEAKDKTTCDGAVHPIKMFSYLLPQLRHSDTEVISANQVKYIIAPARKQTDERVYETALSQSRINCNELRESMADSLMKEVKLPLFIVHN